MTQIRIRHEKEAEALPLADAPFDQLDNVIPTLQAWGVADYDHCDLTGEFVYDPATRAAYFEVTINDPEED